MFFDIENKDNFPSVISHISCYTYNPAVCYQCLILNKKCFKVGSCLTVISKWVFITNEKFITKHRIIITWKSV